jgi:site-specific DNA-methyltransferase (adenine-specific)
VRYHATASSTGSPGAFQNGITAWSSPQWLVDQLAAEFVPDGFDLDPAAMAENAKAPRYFTVDQDGLSQPWHGRVFCNPPYGKYVTPRWLAKAKREVDLGHAQQVVCLVPARVGTWWWRQYEADPAVFTRVVGRIRWDARRRGEAPFDSAVIVFGKLAGRHGRYPAVCANPGCPRPSRRFWPARKDAMTCSSTCRKALSRSHIAARKRDQASTVGVACGHCDGSGHCSLPRCARCGHAGPCAACSGTGRRLRAPEIAA